MSSRKQKWLAYALIAVAALAASAGAVAAYLSTTTGPAQNIFAPDAETNPSIVETFADNVKSNVKVDVGNPGYAVYVRAAIVVTWEDANGNVLPQMPVRDDPNQADDNADYMLTLNTADWFYNPDDGFYYYKAKVNSGLTESLITECRPVKSSPDSNYSLHVDIISQTIQALGTTDAGNLPAVTDAWGIRVDSYGRLYNTVTVANGDTLSEIASTYGTTVEAIVGIEENRITNVNSIVVGNVIYLPNVKKAT